MCTRTWTSQRAAIANALVSWEHASADANESVLVAIRQERDEDARYNMARFLAHNLETFPENRRLLQDLMRSEQSDRIRTQVAEMIFSNQVQ